MTPKQKAKEIYDKFYGIPLYILTIKQSCNIVVDEICKLRLNIGHHLNTDEDKENYYSYWEQVKEEINKL